MYPELFQIGDFSVSTFGLMLMLAFVGSYIQLVRGLERLGVGDAEDASAMVFAAGIGGIAGAKIYYALLYQDWSLLFDRSGLVWYGGFILGTLAVLWVLHSRRLPPWRTADAVAPALALGYGIGRIGCFLVGDDYGKPTDLPWGMAFPEGLPPTTAGSLRAFGVEVAPDLPNSAVLAVHPTQIYETLAALAIWAVGLVLLRRSRRPGSVVLPVFALLAVERFLVEFLRAKDDRFLGPLTVAQAISLAGLALLAVLWFQRPRETAGERSPDDGEGAGATA